MKKMMTAVSLACVLAVGCASMGNTDAVRAAAYSALGTAQVTNDTSNRPSELVELTKLTTHVDDITLNSPTEATVLTTYKYKGRFNTDGGEKSGVLTIQRKMQFTKNGDAWSQSGNAQEVARSSSWSGTKQS
jgi:hypothetical protein